MTANATMHEPSSSVKTLADAVASKIETGQESVLPDELDQLRRVLTNPHESASISYLDRSLLQSGSIPPDRVTLVRYRGMVQDMMDSEYYISEVDGIKTKYRDYCGGADASSIMNENIAKFLKERQLLVVVPVPFSTARVSEEEPSEDVDMEMNTVSRRNKRSLEETPQSSSRKQPVLIRDSPEDTGTPTSVSSLLPIHTAALEWWPAGCMGSDPNQCPVLAKAYNEKSNLKLNQVVDMIGVLSVNPMDAEFDQDQDDLGVVLPPPSLLPRLHVLCCNPVNLDQASSTETMMDITSVGNDQRSLTIKTFSNHVFDGNDTAAEALLMAIFSLAERQESGIPLQATEETTLGCASLNLILKSEDACNKMKLRLLQVLQKLVPVVAVVENESLSLPHKNESGRLVPSALQLPKKSVVIVNQGKKSAAALSSLTKSHVVPYTFEGGMQYNFEADYCVIVLSCFKNKNCNLNLKLGAEVQAAESGLLQDDETCTCIRSYLAQCRSAPSPHGFQNIKLSKAVLDQAQEDFVKRRVQQRQQQRPEVGEDDFHRWLTIVRLEARSRVACSDAQEELHCATVEDWNETLRLDDAMRSGH